MAKLKVFGGLIQRPKGYQARTIVAATSQAKAAAALHCSLSEFRGWWSETGNKVELETATPHPGQVFMARSSMGKEFSPVVRIGGAWVEAPGPFGELT